MANISRPPWQEGGRSHSFRRWMYRGGHPHRLARALNRISAIHFGSGVLSRQHWVTLEVRGRRTGRPISFPLVLVDHGGQRYLVAMLGPTTNWVRNVEAAGGHAILRHGQSEAVHLEQIDPATRAPILRRYLQLAPGARPHVPVDQQTSPNEFDRVASEIPIFRLTADDTR